MSLYHNNNVRLPPHDNMLEMEEVEGLVRNNSHAASNGITHIGNNMRAAAHKNHHPPRRSPILKWCAGFLIVGILVVILFALDVIDLGDSVKDYATSKLKANKNTTDAIKDASSGDCDVVPKDVIQDIVDQTIAAMTKKQEGQQVPANTDGETKVQPPAENPQQAPPPVEPPKQEEKPPEAPAQQQQPQVTPPAEQPPAQPQEQQPQVPPPVEPPKQEEKPPETPAQQQPQENPSATPQDDFYAPYPHRDIPNDKFPATAWQANPTAIKDYVDIATRVVDGAISAILQEYGKDPNAPNMDPMFALDYMDFDKGQAPGPGANAKHGLPQNGGWTTRRSFDGLIRRCLHAMITNDSFTYVLGGHSAAAGHGNHFQQSYAMQFHVVMEPVFRQLGVKLTSRNLAQGGLGTIQSALGSGDIYGHEVDMISWDSGMTEGRNADHIDLYMRQALMGGNRVPLLWGGDSNIFVMLHQNASADIGQFGSGMLGIPVTMNETQAETIPWAARYLVCSAERADLCGANKYRANCWIDRPDVTPPTPQAAKPGGQAGWHPGFRTHQLQGRVLAMTVLQALKAGLEKWKQAGEEELLPESEWHVAEYYENIRSKVMNLDPSLGFCYQIQPILPVRMCKTPMHGRTEFTPRANPEETALTNLLKPDADGWIPHVQQPLLYEGPDVYNPMLHVPEGAVDVVAMINGTTRRERQLTYLRESEITSKMSLRAERTNRRTASSKRKVGMLRRQLDEPIVVGKGWEIHGEPNGRCGGEYDDICGRERGDNCLLNAHHDQRGGLLGNEYSGWLVMDLPAVKAGIIVIKLETWHWPEENQRTAGWTTPNNEGGRELKRPAPEWNDGFVFDIAINGKITSYDKAQFEVKRKMVQRVVECVTVMNDENFGEEQNVEVAIRMRGCGRDMTFKLTHVYWG